MSDFASLYIKVDSSGVVTASKHLDELSGKSQHAEKTTTTATTAMKSAWLGYAAAIGTAMIAMKQMYEIIKMASDFKEQQGVLNNLAKQYKTTAEEIVSSMRKASEGLISNADLMNTALNGIAKGLKPEQLERLAGAAKILADVTGKSTTEALNKMTEALVTGRMRGLESLSGNIDLKDSFGDLAGKLTEAEKAQAMYAIMMIKATEWQNKQTMAVDETAGKIERLEAQYKNLTMTMSVYFKNIAVGAANVAAEVKKGGIVNLLLGGIPTVTAAAAIVGYYHGTGKSSSGSSTSLGMGLPDRESEKTLETLREIVKLREDAEKIKPGKTGGGKSGKASTTKAAAEKDENLIVFGNLDNSVEQAKKLSKELSIQLVSDQEAAMMQIQGFHDDTFDTLTELWNKGALSSEAYMTELQKLSEVTGKKMGDIFGKELPDDFDTLGAEPPPPPMDSPMDASREIIEANIPAIATNPAGNGADACAATATTALTTAKLR